MSLRLIVMGLRAVGFIGKELERRDHSPEAERERAQERREYIEAQKIKNLKLQKVWSYASLNESAIYMWIFVPLVGLPCLLLLMYAFKLSTGSSLIATIGVLTIIHLRKFGIEKTICYFGIFVALLVFAYFDAESHH